MVVVPIEVTADSVEAAADPHVAAEEDPAILQQITLIQTKIKAKADKSLIKKAKRPALMFRIMRVPAIGKKAGLRPIVATLSSVPGSTSSLQDRRTEKSASLAL